MTKPNKTESKIENTDVNQNVFQSQRRQAKKKLHNYMPKVLKTSNHKISVVIKIFLAVLLKVLQ